MEIITILTLFFGILWFASLFMLISKDKIMNRIFQICHSFYLVFFTYLVFRFGVKYFPFHFLAVVELATTIFFTYRFIKSRINDPEDDENVPFDQQLVPEARKEFKKFRKTVDSVFNINSQSKNQ